MSGKFSKITIETNDRDLIVDINKTPTAYATTGIKVGVFIILMESIYLLFISW